MTDDRAAQLILALGLRPHPEGGHYGEVHRSRHVVRPADGRPARPGLTIIYFLLAAGEVSRWHRVASDEAWHYHEGAVLDLAIADADLQVTRSHRLGPFDQGTSCQPTRVVEAGSWQAARTTGAYTLVSCSVGPGFVFDDFVMLRDLPDVAARLVCAHPAYADLV